MTASLAQTCSTRLTWQRLPETTRAAVANQVGPVLATETVVAGFSGQLAETIQTALARFFVKGMRADDPQLWSQDREAALGSHVTPLGPQLLWRVDAGGWDLLGFEYVEGPSADYRRDANAVEAAAAMSALGRLACPPQLDLHTAVQRWGAYLEDPRDIARLDGTALLHTDWNYTNVLLTETGARLVDWPWATRGADWIDPACWVVWLIFAGRSAAEAQRWAARVPAWHNATDQDLDVFARALAAEWCATARRNPNMWTYNLRDASCRWLEYRCATTRMHIR